MNRDCEHGQLARSCSICDLERELKAATEQRDKLLAALEFVVAEWAKGDDVFGSIQHGRAVIAEVNRKKYQYRGKVMRGDVMKVVRAAAEIGKAMP